MNVYANQNSRGIERIQIFTMQNVHLKNSSVNPRRNTEDETLVGRAERALNHDIIAGALTPGARLNVRALVARYAMGATPIREALARISATGLVTILQNRGFRVAGISAADLSDIIVARQVLEVAALRIAIKAGDADWEGRIVSALHRIEKYATATAKKQEWAPGLDDVHKEYHTALIAACGSPRLLQMHSTFYDQTFRYRKIMFTAMPDLDDFVAEHRDLAALVLRRDEAAACRRLANHLTRTLREVYPDAPPPDAAK